MAPFSNDYANQILNYTLAKIPELSAPAMVYIGLCSNDPEADGGTFTELSGGGYERVLIVQKGETYPDVIGSAAGRAITNSKQFNWNKASAGWVMAKGLGLFSVPTGGAPFFYATLDAEVTVPAGAVALFEPGTLKLSFATEDV